MNDPTNEWDDAGIVVVPGLPSDLSTPEGVTAVLPGTALLMVKATRSLGYPIRVATTPDLREVSHHGADIWLPVLNFGFQVLAAGGGGVLAEILGNFLNLTRAAHPRVHVKWRVQKPNGEVAEFRARGSAADVVEAAKAFERSLLAPNDSCE